MPARQKPAYTLHKPTGQARVRIDGKDHYLGAYGSPDSREKYDDLVGDWFLKQDLTNFTLTVDDLCLAFTEFANGYYRNKDGTPTDTIRNMREAMRYLVQFSGTLRVRDFGPKKLKAIREHMISGGRSRKSINSIVHRIRRVFRWGVEEELVPPSVYQALTAVSGLRAGRSMAKENPPVQPVPDHVVDATLEHLRAVVADMVRLQRLTGCRPGEICRLRPCDVDRSGDVWQYTPERHKTEHLGRQRVIMIGPKAQQILGQYLLRPGNQYCFSPGDSERQRLHELHQKRKTPLSCGNRPGTNRRASPKRTPGSRYDKDSYNRAIARACDMAFPPPEPLRRGEKETVKKWRSRLTDRQRGELRRWQRQHRWSPNQLRHSRSTEIRRRYGLEAAQVVLGHARADVTQVYAERDMKLAADVMREVG